MWVRMMVGALALLGAVVSVQAADVEDNCAMCHDSAPVPQSHVAMEVMSLDACTMCHEPQAGDPFVKAVHEAHVDAGFACSDCHGSDAPSAQRLEELLQRR